MSLKICKISRRKFLKMSVVLPVSFAIPLEIGNTSDKKITFSPTEYDSGTYGSSSYGSGLYGMDHIDIFLPFISQKGA